MMLVSCNNVQVFIKHDVFLFNTRVSVKGESEYGLVLGQSGLFPDDLAKWG